ncbi:FeoA family protein [Liquorilactobacillus satsumensis]|uniref:Ferrous iron (Fe2+) uptake protein FeoA n=1 Tax=Liquorilactobacillus satsumensis DSM 16230 = JCM 12392 TaxID=1423801 RepID=A0A0R1UXT5_9LACO|nr:ferrous iron transport protein A [Liquorilactobacillus satsumensis]KRL98096.1 ferrous iron (Fe2+) uptake protein FeoA [Liquorilactobacillus satsumensis DSM 16230 = JCM 12392]MCC7667350.1 ferrous iron transport protein A [Liquorilactobacillus satsumensis]MCP9313209.1 ferrous iron transport protein A [Liquorilactobacillus satsumensis]MCP9358210.1 ferrous iron transport protein A [Liquorilactobacillus satsumensis]MCP9360430.1 ferrous iron transport protein A [Liquorilactobacillus satsumensis]
MESLARVNQKGKYIVTDILGNPRFVRRLNEIGMVVGVNLTVISTSQGESGMVIYLRGQRLALNHSVAALIVVRQLDEAGTQDYKALSAVAVGAEAIVAKVVGDKRIRKRLLDMGLTKNTVVKINQTAPLGDPLELLLRGYKLSLRKQEADYVLVTEVEQ